MQEVEKLIRNYLADSKTHMMQLATVRDGQPWICNVWFAADDECNIYWFSATKRRHSLEVADNGKVAGSICDPQGPDDDAVALQFQGSAQELSEPEDIAKARAVYEGRIFDTEAIDKFMTNPDHAHRFYRIKPELFILFDAVHFPSNTRQEWRPNA